jgi:hypothetical protein
MPRLHDANRYFEHEVRGSRPAATNSRTALRMIGSPIERAKRLTATGPWRARANAQPNNRAVDVPASAEALGDRRELGRQNGYPGVLRLFRTLIAVAANAFDAHGHQAGAMCLVLVAVPSFSSSAASVRLIERSRAAAALMCEIHDEGQQIPGSRLWSTGHRQRRRRSWTR